MKKYIIDEEELKELLYDHYVLNCLYEYGVDNWFGYMENRTEYINSMLGKKPYQDDWDEDADFIDIVEINLPKYKELPNEINNILNSENTDYIEGQIKNYINKMLNEMRGE